MRGADATPMPSDWVAAVLVLCSLLATNAILAVLLYWKERTALHRTLLLLWLALIVALVAQALVPGLPESVYAFAPAVFVVNVCIVDLVRRALVLPARFRLYVAIAVASILASLLPFALGAPFWVIALLPAIAVAFPLFHVAHAALVDPRPLSPVARWVVGTAVFYGLHELDYPFLRAVPQFIGPSFSIAVAAIFALSIGAPAIILEQTAAEVRRLQAIAIERERLSALGEASAVVAHEVRNPLGTMTNTIELLQKEPLSADARELLSIQRIEVQRLDRLVRDLLSFSKPLAPKLGEVEVTGLIRHAARSLRADADARQVELEVADDPEHVVHGDADSILLALVNVLQNAIQSSPIGGRVRVSASNGGGHVRVAVDDEGAGVPPELIDRIFKPFVTTRATGSGLGLAIIDRVMKAHGGSVRVTNLPDKGARFELVFEAS